MKIESCKIKTFIFLFFVVSCFYSFMGVLCAEPLQDKVSPERQFARGNDFYEKGEYDKAITEYTNIISEGYASGEIYYNLGGAYFKKGDLGKALLNYKKAEFFIPRSADLNANYKFAKEKINGKVIPDKGIWAWRPIRMYSNFFTINELTILCSIMYCAILVVFIVTIIFPLTKKYRLWITVFFVCGILFTSLIIYHKIKDINSFAIIIRTEVEALFGPFESATKFFALKEGMLVRVISSKDDWYKVKRGDGKVAWIRKSDVEKVW